MPHVLTLVAAGGSVLEPAEAATDALRAADADPGAARPLAHSACDIELGLDDRDELSIAGLVADLTETVRIALDEGVEDFGAVDLAIQPAANRRKRLLVADMESTVIENEMLEELADFVGVREKVEDITTRAMNGELDFRAALEERVALLEGLPASTLDECLDVIRFDPGAATLVATMRAHGALCALVSGGFTYFGEWVAGRIGFEEVRANVLDVADGRLTGTVTPPILDRDAKVKALDELCARLGLDAADAVTVGDGANDLPMLLAAGLGVAYHGKPSVAARARFRIDHGDLRTLLYFQGYRDDEIQAAL